MAENPDNDNLESYLTQIHTLYGAMQLRDPQYADSFRRALGTIVTMAERGNSLSFIEERLPEARPEKPLEILRELLRREQLALELAEEPPQSPRRVYRGKSDLVFYEKRKY